MLCGLARPPLHEELVEEKELSPGREAEHDCAASAGEAAIRYEKLSVADAGARVVRMLREIYEPKGVTVPDPLDVRFWFIFFACPLTCVATT